jgi:CubicO group peptidase (beta-lactamase class C family)
MVPRRALTPRSARIVRHVEDLQQRFDALAEETGFAGVVRIDREGQDAIECAYGLAHRAYEIPNTADTRFGIASGAKGFTAVTVMSLVEEGSLQLSTTARSILGDDLPLIRDDVTLEHLLSHTSGIGDYYDEDVETDVSSYVMPVPVHELATTEQYLTVLDGHETKFAPGERFSYSNSGYVVLALIAERASGVAFHELVRARVCEPAELRDTAFLRSDELPERTACGYVEVDGAWRTNVFHLPVRGSGDGGMYTTASDLSTFWRAFFAGEILRPETVREMVRPHTPQYGLGFWLEPASELVRLEGSDAGVSFYSVCRPAEGLSWSVISNTTDGAWPLARFLRECLTSA